VSDVIAAAPPVDGRDALTTGTLALSVLGLGAGAWAADDEQAASAMTVRVPQTQSSRRSLIVNLTSPGVTWQGSYHRQDRQYGRLTLNNYSRFHSTL
jgi:hypothetical protein